MVCEPDAATHPTPQDHQLMSKHRVLSLKPQLRLERQGQDGQNETKQSNHSASLGDFFTSSTRIRFSVHTTAPRRRADDPVALLRLIPCRHQAGHRDSYFVLASSRITNRSPLQSSTANRSTRRWAFSIASASSVPTIGSRLTKCPS